MLRRASTALFCALALVAPAYSQEIFVPRELKAVPVHPAKPKEVVRRAEPVADADAKPVKEAATTETARAKAPRTEPATAKTDKTAPKEKSPAVTDEASKNKTAKADAPKEKSDKPASKEKPVVAKTSPADDVATIKVEKAAATKDSTTNKTVAKAEPAKEKKDKTAPAKEKSDGDIPMIKVEKVTTAKEPATKTVAKTEPAKPEPSKEKADKAVAVKEKPASEAAKTAPAKKETSVAKSEKAAPKDEAAHKNVAKNESVKVETVTAKTEKPAVKDKPATVAASRTLKEEKAAAKEEPASKVSKTDTAKSEVTVAKSEKAPVVKEKEKPAVAATKAQTAKSEALIAKVEPAPPREGPPGSAKLPIKSEQVSVPTQKDAPQIIPAVSGSLDTGFTKIADGFDFPVGKPEAEGYYKARGFRAGGHVGEDWDGVRGGDTDLRDPIYSVGDGIVVFARDVHLGWGNVIIVRHAYRENGNVRYVDALYGHLNSMLVGRGQRVTRGQQIATMGTAHGQYDAHLHFEIRKNLEIGMSRSKFQKDFSNYYDPTQFINSHRHLSGGGANYKVAMNTFTHDWTYHFDKNRDFGPRKRGTGESSAALRKALTSTR